MDPKVVKALFELRSGSMGQDYVFVNERTKTRIKEVKEAFGTALKIAGIKGLVWHDLRVTFGTRLGEAGYDAFTIAALMGHSQIQTIGSGGGGSNSRPWGYEPIVPLFSIPKNLHKPVKSERVACRHKVANASCGGNSLMDCGKFMAAFLYG